MERGSNKVTIQKRSIKKKKFRKAREMFIINIVPKAYENVKKIQNEAVHSNMSDMQIAEKKQINNG